MRMTKTVSIWGVRRVQKGDEEGEWKKKTNKQKQKQEDEY